MKGQNLLDSIIETKLIYFVMGSGAEGKCVILFPDSVLKCHSTILNKQYFDLIIRYHSPSEFSEDNIISVNLNDGTKDASKKMKGKK